MKRIVLLTALALGMALPALAEPPQVKNGMIVDDEGMTLYTLDRDSAGTSMCNDGCAMKWPPAMA
ncbi:MAG: hypothetical protein JO171_16255, partial [Paludibacterium sp.]|nr:hypothetical protein [Paludibacterium sp.]